MSQYACLYFNSDKSISVLPKSKCRLRGPFQCKEEVEVDWRDESGAKQRLIAIILKVGGKGKQFLHIIFHFYRIAYRKKSVLFQIDGLI